jgi:exopolysaccharide biosynthesis polyprenyl glycosylphosphotransferase
VHRPWLHASILALLDLAGLLLAVWAAHTFWLWYNPQLAWVVQVRLWELFPPNPWAPPLLVLIPAWLLANNLLGLHNPAKLERSAKIATLLTRSAVYVMLVLVVLQFLFSQRSYSRSLMLLFIGSGFSITVALRLAFFQVQLRLPRPFASQAVAIYGGGSEALSMTQRLESFGRHAYTLAGYIIPSREHTLMVPPDRVLGTVDDLPQMVNDQNLSMVIIASRELDRRDAFHLARLCDRMGLRVLQMPFTWGFASPKLGFASLGGLQLIDLQQLSYPTFAENVKRAFDLAAVLTGGALLAPFLLMVATLVKLDSPGPVFFTSPRVGKGGRNFPFFKFRSMVADANTMKDDLRERNESDGRLFKMKDDPRITRFGKFIRKFSIDELPQLWNVLRGDMNLVGPRPLPAEDLRDMERDPEALYWFELRSKVKPGITGLWQVSGRSSLTFADMVALDIQYVQNWSLWLDLQILFKTIPAVLKGSGAH